MASKHRAWPVGANLFDGVPDQAAEEQVTVLLSAPGVRIERIVSTGQASPPGFWYDQDWDEWVALLAGRAALFFEGETAARVLDPGSWLTIPAHVRHRVAWTSTSPPAIWLAVHRKPDDSSARR